MATAAPVPASFPGEPSRGSSVVLLLRLEGLAIALLTAVLYARLHARTGVSWWLFAALWIVPDLSLLGYLASPCTGARFYNTLHTYFLPAIVALLAFWLHPTGPFVAIALIWANHIGIDRALGYGLKYAEGFRFTHLGRVGSPRA